MDKHELYYEVARIKYQETYQRNRDFDVKAMGLLTLSVALVGVAGIVVRASGTPSEPVLTGFAVSLAAALMIAWAVTFSCALRTLFLRNWAAQPELNAFVEYIDSEDYDDDQMLRWAADQFKNANNQNREVLNEKARWLMVGQVTAGLLVVCFVVLVSYVYV